VSRLRDILQKEGPDKTQTQKKPARRKMRCKENSRQKGGPRGVGRSLGVKVLGRAKKRFTQGKMGGNGRPKNQSYLREWKKKKGGIGVNEGKTVFVEKRGGGNNENAGVKLWNAIKITTCLPNRNGGASFSLRELPTAINEKKGGERRLQQKRKESKQESRRKSHEDKFTMNFAEERIL